MALLKKALLFCALFCLFLLPVRGQLVYNPQFHLVQPSLSNCATANVTLGTSPSGSNPIQNMCQYWYTPTQGSPDFFYGCDIGSSDFGVPTNARFGTYRFPEAEDPFYPSASSSPNLRAYAGIDIIDAIFPFTSIHTREYITQTLPTPLLAGNRYEVSFMVMAYGQPGHDYVERLGCLLSTATPTATGAGVIPKTAGDFGDQEKIGGWDKFSWQTVRANVLITGSNKQVLTIGNFETNNWFADTIPLSGHAYYLIDNVQICEACAINVSATRVASADPTKCCYDFGFTYTSNNSCQAHGFRLRSVSGYPPASVMATHSALITGAANEKFRVCVDRFTSGVVLVDILAADGSVLCTKSVELPCNCKCDNTVVANPSGFSVALERTPASPECCWNIVVKNNGNCDVLLRGVGVSVGAPASLTLAAGYGMYPAPTVPPSNYISKNNTNGGDNYAVGTTTVIGTVCLPVGTANVPVFIQFLRSIANDGYIEYCGGTYNTTLSCGVIGVPKMGASTPEDVRQMGLAAVPNPASDATTIHYTVREQSDVRIQMYTATGELVAELQPGVMQAGEQRSTLSTTELSSGTYYVRVQIGNATATIPVAIVK